jgi:probable rRNA maturation factor
MADRPPSRQTRRRVGPDDGSLSVFVADERNDEADAPIDGRRWVSLAEQVLEAEGVRGDVELSVLFVDESAMASLNERFMGSTGATDVLAFPIDGELVEPGRWPDGGTEGPERAVTDTAELPLLLGDVVICPAVAARQAPEHAGELDDELALLLVHGVLHLLGHDHADDGQRAAMQARERDLLARFHVPLTRDPWGS